jgi:hypothetical protein
VQIPGADLAVVEPATLLRRTDGAAVFAVIQRFRLLLPFQQFDFGRAIEVPDKINTLAIHLAIAARLPLTAARPATRQPS